MSFKKHLDEIESKWGEKFNETQVGIAELFYQCGRVDALKDSSKKLDVLMDGLKELNRRYE